MSDRILRIVDHLAALGYFVFIIGGLLGLAIRRIRVFCGAALYAASFAIGLDVWVWSAFTVHYLWGTFALVIGLLLAGIGVAPMAILASLIHRDWVTFGYLLINLAALFICRMAGVWLLEHD